MRKHVDTLFFFFRGNDDNYAVVFHLELVTGEISHSRVLF